MIDSSKFAMWRATVAVILVDGKIDPQEKKWFDEKVQNLKLTTEQKEILNSDIINGVNFDSIVEYITKPSDRAFLLHLIRTLGHIDNHFSEDEQEIFNAYKTKIMSGVDLEKAEISTRKFTMTEDDSSEDDKSLFQKVINLIF